MKTKSQIRFETDRLLIREILPKDFDGYVKLHTNKNVTDSIPMPLWDMEKCKSEFSNRIKETINPNRERKIWTIEHKSTNEFIGLCGLLFENNQGHELAYRLCEPFWNKGYATEVSKGLIHYAISNLKAKRIFADAYIENKASNLILEKLLHFTSKSYSEKYGCWDNHYELLVT